MVHSSSLGNRFGTVGLGHYVRDSRYLHFSNKCFSCGQNKLSYKNLAFISLYLDLLVADSAELSTYKVDNHVGTKCGQFLINISAN